MLICFRSVMSTDDATSLKICWTFILALMTILHQVCLLYEISFHYFVTLRITVQLKSVTLCILFSIVPLLVFLELRIACWRLISTLSIWITVLLSEILVQVPRSIHSLFCQRSKTCTFSACCCILIGRDYSRFRLIYCLFLL